MGQKIETSSAEIKIEFRVPLPTVADTLCSAFEGGSSYWASVTNKTEPDEWKWEDMSGIIESKNSHWLHEYPLNPGGELEITDHEARPEMNERVKLCLHRAKVVVGLQVMAEKFPKHFADMVAETGDANTGDVLLQCCLFGDVIYG